MSSAVSVPGWAAVLFTLITASIAPSISYVAARWQRRTGTETIAAMDRSAHVAQASAAASMKSADAAHRAAETATEAERHLDKFRHHDDTMKTLYWAADHAIASESSRALLGLEVLKTLVQQARTDADHRAGLIVTATDEAVRKVAIPTSMSVLTSAANSDTNIGGRHAVTADHMVVTAVEINAAGLLLAHARDLSPALAAEIRRIAESSPGSAVKIEHLRVGRHLERDQSHVRTQHWDRNRAREPRGRDVPTRTRQPNRNLVRNRVSRSRGLSRGR